MSSASSPFRVTGSDLVAGRPITGGSRPVWTNQITSVRGLGLLLQFNGSTVQSQQHGDRFLQELAELCEPLRADRAVHHPVVAAQRHRHHAGYVEPAKPRTQPASDLIFLKCNLLYYYSHDTDPFSLSAGISRFSEPPTARIQD